jgi:hypothetical protein
LRFSTKEGQREKGEREEKRENGIEIPITSKREKRALCFTQGVCVAYFGIARGVSRARVWRPLFYRQANSIWFQRSTLRIGTSTFNSNPVHTVAHR